MKLSGMFKLLAKVPLFGSLTDCTFRDHAAAIKELSTVHIFSTAPIWLGIYIVYVSGNSGDFSSFVSACLSTISGGELFIYCTMMLAPLFWIALEDPKGASVFPTRRPHMVLIGIVNLFAACSFGLLKTGQFQRPDLILLASGVLFSVSLLLLYLGTVYHNSRLQLSGKILQGQTADFLEKYSAHRDK